MAVTAARSPLSASALNGSRSRSYRPDQLAREVVGEGGAAAVARHEHAAAPLEPGAECAAPPLEPVELGGQRRQPTLGRDQVRLERAAVLDGHADTAQGAWGSGSWGRTPRRA